jgi:O-antigen/teichoic acid export membrane protein/2-polyprenyl-3-methyl-5-hydroxy-6-metoxy-1,4-benzoquinol methylase
MRSLRPVHPIDHCALTITEQFLNPSATGSGKSDTGQALDTSERVRLMLDGIINNLNPLVSGAVGILQLPILLHGLGAEAYGLWIIALSLPGIVGAVDFGLGLSVTLQVSGCRDSNSRRQAARFVMAAGNTHVVMGLVGAAVIGVLGFFSGNSLHLKPSDIRLIPALIGLVGLSHVCERVGGLEGEILWGLRRFDLTNLISIAAIVLEFGGTVGLVAAGKGLVYVAAWHAVVAAGAAYASYATVARLEPLFRLRPGRIEWDAIRPSIRFSLASQFAEAARSFLWQAPPIVIGLVLGSSSVVPFHIGRRIPQMISALYMRASAVFFPAVSEHAQGRNRASIREILEVGTRWVVVWALPVCMVLWILAPELLQAWISNVSPGTVLIFRLITAAVFAEAVAAASIQVLWALGAMRTVSVIPSAVVVTSVGLTLVLLPRVGVVGAAWGLSLPMTLGAVAFTHLAARTCGIRIRDLVHTAFGGLFLPVAVCLVISLSISFWSGPGWRGVIATALGGGFGYVLVFYFNGAREEELMLMHQGLAAPVTFGRFLYGRLRRLLRRVGFIRSGYYLMLAIQDAFLDSTARGRAELNREFEPRADPWDYATVPYQRDRIRTEVAMLDAIRGEARFGKALEVGCAEGIFTQPLAERCDSLLSVDISSVALARARRRCDWDEHVRFAEWDLRVDPLPDSYDLIVMIHALEYIRNPIYVYRARAKLVAGLRPGGFLLVGTMKIGEVWENAWWGRYFLRSGKRINAFFAQHPALKLVKTTEFYLGKDYVSYDVLFKKTL